MAKPKADWSTRGPALPRFHGFNKEQVAQIETIIREQPQRKRGTPVSDFSVSEFLRELESLLIRYEPNFMDHYDQRTRDQKLDAARKLSHDLKNLNKKLQTPELGGLSTAVHFCLSKSGEETREFFNRLTHDLRTLRRSVGGAWKLTKREQQDKTSIKELREKLAEEIAELFSGVLMKKASSTFNTDHGRKGKYARILEVCFSALGDRPKIRDLVTKCHKGITGKLSDEMKTRIAGSGPTGENTFTELEQIIQNFWMAGLSLDTIRYRCELIGLPADDVEAAITSFLEKQFGEKAEAARVALTKKHDKPR